MDLPRPPILFRAASGRSRGLNTTDEIDPLHSYHARYHINPASMDVPTLSDMIYHQIRWKCKVPSEFSHWSVSLLYVLIHAVRRRFDQFWSPVGESNVLVYIMDTSLLPTWNSLHAAAELIRADGYELHFPPKRIRPDYIDKGYFRHEYLIHGKIHSTAGLRKAVALDGLLNAGF